MENGEPVEISRELISEKLLSSTTVQKEVNDASVRAYFTEMGIDAAAIMPLVTATPHTDIRWTTPDERRATRLVTRVATGATLLPAAIPPAPTEAAATASVPRIPPGTVVPSDLSTGLTLLVPPGADTIHMFVQLKSSDAQLHADRFSADLQFANGKRLTAVGTGSGADDPLYATLPGDELCALRRSGDLMLKMAIDTTARDGPPQRFSLDLAKSANVVAFAAKRCK